VRTRDAMTARERGSGLRALHQAFDEARFGPARTLNLRNTLPTAREAVARVEAWLRERQASRAGELLVITGRGNQSEGGISAVREAVVHLLASLRRRGVVEAVSEHTPGSFVVMPAPLRALRAAARRRREPEERPLADPTALRALEPATRALLRDVARRAIEYLGVQEAAPFIEREMLAQFSVVAPGVPDGPDREARLRAALQALLLEFDDV
jgi:hypothetical protein